MLPSPATLKNAPPKKQQPKKTEGSGRERRPMNGDAFSCAWIHSAPWDTRLAAAKLGTRSHPTAIPSSHSSYELKRVLPCGCNTSFTPNPPPLSRETSRAVVVRIIVYGTRILIDYRKIDPYETFIDNQSRNYASLLECRWSTNMIKCGEAYNLTMLRRISAK